MTANNERFVVHHSFPIRLFTAFITSLKDMKLITRNVTFPELRLPKGNVDLYYISTICDWLLETAELPKDRITKIVFKARDLTDMLWLRDTLSWLKLKYAAAAVEDRLPRVIRSKAATQEDIATFFEVTQYSSPLVDELFNAMALHEAQGRLPDFEEILQYLEEEHRRILPRYLRARIDHGCEGAVEALRVLNEEYYNSDGKHQGKRAEG
jgi:hypothetical protein